MSMEKSIDKKREYGLHLIQVQRFKEAEDIFASLLSNDTFNEEYYFFLALSQYTQDKNHEALENYKLALEYGYDAEVCFEYIGCVYTELEMYIEAEEAFLEGLRINPQNPDLLAKYGSLMLKTGYEDKAIMLFNDALQIDPANTEATKSLAIYHLIMNGKKASEPYMQSLCENEGQTVVITNIINQCLIKGDYKTAHEYAKQLYLMYPTNEGFLELLEEIEDSRRILMRPILWFRGVGGLRGCVSIFFILMMLGIGLNSKILMLAALPIQLIKYFNVFIFIPIIIFDSIRKRAKKYRRTRRDKKWTS